jgi:uncharacterized RDD family membrane protein YckC
MAETVSFETPENVVVSYEPAGLGSRFAAWMLDEFLVTLATIVVMILLMMASSIGEYLNDLGQSFQPSNDDDPAQYLAYAFGLIYLFFSLGSFVYFGASELFLRGQTVGKRRLGIRVVQANGFALLPGSVLLRTVFRVLDHLPVLWVVPLVTKRSQRIGDLVAGTIVVRDKVEALDGLRDQLLNRSGELTTFRFPNTVLAKATPQDKATVERFVGRYEAMQEPARAELLERIVASLCRRLALDEPREAQRLQFLHDFLAAVYRRDYRRLG